MTINLADNTPRKSYTVTAGSSASSFDTDFEFFVDADLDVFVDGVQKTLATDYTVTGGNGTTGTVTFNSAISAGASNVIVVLTRSIAIERTTDFPSAGPFDIASLNLGLDKIIAIQADLKDDIDRSLRLTDFDVDATLTLPAVDTRKGKTLAFNATTGAVEAGPSISDVQTVSAASADIATLADTQDGTTSTNGISTLAGISSSITTVAGIPSSVTTVAGMNSNISTVVANLTDIQNAEEHAQEAKDYATKVNGQVQENSVDTGNYSSKAWAVGGTGVTDAAGAGAAKEWAVDQSADGVDGTEWSAKEYAIGTQSGNTEGSAKQWALGGGVGFDTATPVTGSGSTSKYSAKYYADLAEQSKTEFSNIYHGQSGTAPTGSEVGAGDLWFDSANNVLKYYNTSNQWVAIAAVDTSSFATTGSSIAMAIAL